MVSSVSSFSSRTWALLLGAEMVLGHTLFKQKCPIPNFFSWPNLLFIFLIAEKLSKLSAGEKATKEELLVLLEEGIWNNIQQQEIQRFVHCNLNLFPSKLYCSMYVCIVFLLISQMFSANPSSQACPTSGSQAPCGLGWPWMWPNTNV